MKTLKVLTKDCKTLSWNKLQGYEFNSLKQSDQRDVSKLKNAIVNNGFAFPFFIWKKYVIDGKGRDLALKELEEEGYIIPDLPYVEIEAENIEQAKKLVLMASSQHGKITKESLELFIEEIELDVEEINLNIEEVELNIEDVQESPDVNKENKESANLIDSFVVPPFSTLDTRQQYWQDRKKWWKSFILDSGETREDSLGRILSEEQKKKQNSKFKNISDGVFKGQIVQTVSILDPVLAEISNLWFGLPECNTFDCFAGDSVFGYVSSYLGHKFTGIELRQEQSDINNQRIKDFTNSKYICDDGQNVLKHIKEDSQDFLFSCPPYYDLEVYSDLPNDASNQDTYEDFLGILNKAFSGAIKCLKNNRFAVITVGDIRDKQGFYRDFIGAIKNIFKENGMLVLNEIILLEVIGTHALKASGTMKHRKVQKMHQNVLVFYKGNPKEIKNIFPQLDFKENES